MFKRGKGRNSLGLIDASQNGDLARVKAKLKAGCDVNSRDEVRAHRAHKLAPTHHSPVMPRAWHRGVGAAPWRTHGRCGSVSLLLRAVVGNSPLHGLCADCHACALT
jgi:hypothetical protein